MIALGSGLQFVRQCIEQHFRIGVGIDVPQVLAEHLLLEFFGVGQVAVVPENDPEWRVDIKRL